MKLRRTNKKPAPVAIAPVVPEPPQGIMTSKPVVIPDGLWSEKNAEWLKLSDRTAYIKGNPVVGGPLIAVYSHRDNICECGEIRKGQHGYAPALCYKRLHNFFTPVDQADADKKVKQAEKEYSNL